MLALITAPPVILPGGRRLAPLKGAVRAVLEDVHPGCSVTAHAMAAVLELLSRALDKIFAASAAAWAVDESGPLLTSVHVLEGVAMAFPKDSGLSTLALVEMAKAAAKLEKGDESGGLTLSPALIGPGLVAAFGCDWSHVPVDGSALTACAAALEYLSAELWEISDNCARDHRRLSITAEDVLISVNNDSELSEFGLFEQQMKASAASLMFGRNCEEENFQWRSRDPAKDLAEFGWAVSEDSEPSGDFSGATAVAGSL